MNHRQLGDVFSYVLLKVREVALEILEKLLKPLLPMIIGSLKRNRAEGANAEESVALEDSLELDPKIPLWDDNAGCLQAGEIECLARRGAGDGATSEGVTDLGKWGEYVTLVDQIGVDLVRDDEHVVFEADLPESDQFFPCPHASHRIVRTAQDGQLDLAIAALVVEVSEVHSIATVLVDQGVKG